MDRDDNTSGLYANRARQAFRCPVDDPTKLPARLLQGNNKFLGKTMNLSHAGMLLAFDRPTGPVAVGSHVDISLQTPAGLARISGVIRHCTRRFCGIEFVSREKSSSFEPPLRLQQSIFAAQKNYLEKRRRNGR